MKRPKRRHTGATRTKLKILFRILFVIVAAAVITALAILLGMHLKNKASSVESLLDETGILIPEGEGREERTLPSGVAAENRDPSLKIVAADLDLSKNTEEDLMARLISLPSFYDAVSLRITKDGSLLYVSPAVASMTRQAIPEVTPEKDEIFVSLNEINDIVTVASARGYRVSILYESAPAVLGGDASDLALRIDLAVIGEIAALSPGEIVIDGLFPEDGTLDFDTLSALIEYLASLRSVSGSVSLGVVLPSRVFLDATTAAQIMTLSEYTDLLAIGIPVDGSAGEDGAYSSVGYDCYPLRGNFETYNLRAVVKSDSEAACRGAYRSLTDLGVSNVQFTVFLSDAKEKDAEEPSGSTDDEPPIDERTNENAMTKDKYSDEPEQTEEKEPAAETEGTSSAEPWGAAATPGG